MSRRFQFTLRALLLAMLVVAAFFGGMAMYRQFFVDQDHDRNNLRWQSDQLAEQLDVERANSEQLAANVEIIRAELLREKKKHPPTVTTFVSDANDDEIATMIKRFEQVDRPDQMRDVYRFLFEEAGPERLPMLQTLADDSIAIQAAWESVARTVPLEYGNTVYRPDTKTIRWFLGFLQGRARCSPPDWWRDIVLDARANRRDNIYAGELSASLYHPAGVDMLRCPIDAVIERKGDSVVFRVGRDSMPIPDVLLRHSVDGYLGSNISGCFTRTHCFLTEHGDIGHPHQLACIERATERLAWTSEVCGCWWGFASGAPGESWVSIVPTDDGRVFVFGAAGTGFYAHGFRVSDGTSLAQFSSSY